MYLFSSAPDYATLCFRCLEGQELNLTLNLQKTMVFMKALEVVDSYHYRYSSH